MPTTTNATPIKGGITNLLLRLVISGERSNPPMKGGCAEVGVVIEGLNCHSLACFVLPVDFSRLSRMTFTDDANSSSGKARAIAPDE